MNKVSVYILECSDGTFYTGSTNSLQKRLEEHALGLGSIYTKDRLPIKLVFCEGYSRIDEAFAREKQIQGWSRAKKIAVIQQRYQDLPKLSTSKNKDIAKD